MPLKPVPYRSLRALLRRELLTEEHAETARLIRRLAHVKATGGFTRSRVPRDVPLEEPALAAPLRAQLRGDDPARVARGARRAQRARAHDRLIALPGVSVATASAILTLIDPRRYGVLDIRCWQILFSIRSVAGNERGRAFTVSQWEQYLERLRGHARALDVSARMIEYTLFHCHRRLQRGRLYD